VVTNIDADHLENYGGDFERVKAAFNEFLHRLPFYGLAVLCVDDAEVAQLAAATPRHLITYGIDSPADVYARHVRQDGACMHFTLHLPEAAPQAVTLNLPGRHNVLNALAAAAIGWQLGVEPPAIAAALLKFQGIGRRFNLKGELDFGRGKALLVDDYGHHPRELEAVFAAARGGWPERRLVVAFQPHRYSRTRDLFDDFAAVLSSADAVLLTDVYPAGETPIAGADAKSLARAIRARGRIDPVLAGAARDLPTVLADVLADGDLLLVMGAGDIGAVAVDLATHGLKGAPQA
ncbi:MAG: UDP-N-acetylmuramate--L-alanine ligase, partial [Arenimonas sp.]|nr:UDP-N-acetylmuramate--L-alanine ligase [Arenimonas sp.]